MAAGIDAAFAPNHNVVFGCLSILCRIGADVSCGSAESVHRSQQPGGLREMEREKSKNKTNTKQADLQHKSRAHRAEGTGDPGGPVRQRMHQQGCGRETRRANRIHLLASSPDNGILPIVPSWYEYCVLRTHRVESLGRKTEVLLPVPRQRRRRQSNPPWLWVVMGYGIWVPSRLVCAGRSVTTHPNPKRLAGRESQGARRLSSRGSRV